MPFEILGALCVWMDIQKTSAKFSISIMIRDLQTWTLGRKLVSKTTVRHWYSLHRANRLEFCSEKSAVFVQQTARGASPGHLAL